MAHDISDLAFEDLRRLDVAVPCKRHVSENNMNRSVIKRMRSAGFVVAALLMTATTSIISAHADEADAKRLFKAMSDYLAAQKAISFEFDTSLEVTTKKEQKFALASSGAVTLNRPDKLRATRTGGFADVELVFDGKLLSLLGKNRNLYAQVEMPGTVDQLVDKLRDKFNRPLPAADLLVSNPYDELMPLVMNMKDLGSGVIRGVECDYLAFRTKDAVDVQIWIAQGDRPYPCRYVVTNTMVKGWPSYTIDVRSWKTGSEVASDDFAFKAPAGAKQVKKLADIPDIDELPDNFRPAK